MSPSNTPLLKPLKHREYAEFMTIAAGFRCRDGVIIAADERITELNVERNQKKLLDCSRIPGCFVKLAPAGDFEAASTCAELMRENGCFNEVAAESIRALKSALNQFMQSQEYLNFLGIEIQDGSPSFQAIIALQARDFKTDLYCMEGTRLYPIQDYRCIGAGYDIGMFFAKWLYRPIFPLSLMNQVVIQVLRASKGHSSGVGGPSDIACLSNVPIMAPRFVIHNDAELFWGIFDLLRPVLYGCVDRTIPDDDFRRALENMLKRIVDKRALTMLPEEPEFQEPTKHDL